MRSASFLAVLCLASLAAAALPRGHRILQTDFEEPYPLSRWTGAARLVSNGTGHALRIERPAPAPPAGSTVTQVSFSADALRGHTLYCSARIRAENVSAKPNPWNGVKFMLAIEAPSGRSWPAASFDAGSFDWKPATFAARIPDDATRITLVLGLESVTGAAEFDDLRIVVGKPPRNPSARPRAAQLYKGHDLPRLRGAMIHTNVDEAGLRTLGQEWNANLIRWQLIRSVPPGRNTPLPEYDAWLDGELKKLDAALPLCRKYGLRIVLDLHSPPGGARTVSGYIGSDAGLFTDPAAQAKFIEVWQRMARRYKGNPIFWGFDIANEPVEDIVGDGCDDWQTLAQRAARAITEIDPQRTIIVEPADWGSPESIRNLDPIDAPNVVYSVHMYIPHAFTHQNVHGASEPIRYPGPIAGKTWDKNQLKAALQPVIDFQRRYNVHIYIGEFSAIRWAPDQSAARYLSDVIDIFEENQWDWSYHAFREWHGWSVEHGDDRANTRPASAPTPRQQLLCGWLRRNQKPNW